MSKVFVTVLIFLFFAGSILAGTTGKIAGTVKDQDTGEPLVGANVVVLDTRMGAAVDVDGAFFIINVPP